VGPPSLLGEDEGTASNVQNWLDGTPWLSVHRATLHGLRRVPLDLRNPMKKIFSLTPWLLAFGWSAALQAQAPSAAFIEENLTYAQQQYRLLLGEVGETPLSPRSLKGGKVTLVKAEDWTSGFFAGNLWYLYEATGQAFWRAAAEQHTAYLERLKDYRGTHDLGFMLYCSYGNGLRLTGNPAYRAVLTTGAASLASRFNEKIGCIRSWDHSTHWKYPVIIDNMMNLEFLFWAERATGEKRFREISVRHADTTLKNHFRPDGSSVHVVSYDPTTGAVEVRQTAQGAADDSAWARGQAWGLYGYTVMYRETKDTRYLRQAEKIADFMISHPRMPADKVPYWDFDAPGIPQVPRDAAAAAIMCAGLLELHSMVEAKKGADYLAFADAQLVSLASPTYRYPAGEGHGFLLQHCTGHHPERSEIDVPLIYADYYFLEALLRRKALLKE
jgi:unsaturated chondroitin disaccharide hydrolase